VALPQGGGRLHEKLPPRLINDVPARSATKMKQVQAGPSKSIDLPIDEILSRDHSMTATLTKQEMAEVRIPVTHEKGMPRT
jgi:hypothetical protein